MENSTPPGDFHNRAQKIQLIPAAVQTIRSSHDYVEIWLYLQAKGVESYGRKFKLYEEDTEIILRLIAWFLQDKDVAQEKAIDLGKGILLVGPVGCGKTSLMNICRYLVPIDQRHRVKSCRDISFEFSRDGYPAIHRYTKGSFSDYKFEPVIYCFDDLGLENVIHYFGNQCSVMQEIILSRYDYFYSFRMFSHITTNLNSNEIEKMYGLRVRSRMREMFNLIAFTTDAKDKRK
jgi:hypothetical protein